MKRKILQLSPFLIIGLIIIFTWFSFLTGQSDGFINLYHWVGVILFISNIIFYIRNFDLGLLLTGIYLFLATLNLLEIFEATDSISFSFGLGENKFQLPGIEIKCFLIFLIYLLINFSVVKLFWRNKFKKFV